MLFRSQNKVQLELYLPDQMPAVKAEIIVANILFNPLKSLAPQLLTLLAPNGLLVMSGILIEQVEPLIEHYQALGTKLVSSMEQGDWAQVVLANAEG